MTESENEKIVRKVYEAFQSKDLDALQSYLSDDFKWIGASLGEYDIEGFRRASLRDYEAFPDGKIDIKRVVAQGNTIVLENFTSGTHSETNKRVEFPSVEIFELEDGKVKLWKTYCNMALIRQQISE